MTTRQPLSLQIAAVSHRWAESESNNQSVCVCEFMCVYELTINKKDQCECVCSYSSGYDGEKLQDIGFGLNNETDYKILK